MWLTVLIVRASQVLRQYRLEKEAQQGQYDFAAGPPDVSTLDGPERLAVLRKYRHWQVERDTAALAVATTNDRSLPAGFAVAHRDDADKPAPPKAMPLSFDMSAVEQAVPSDENAPTNATPSRPAGPAAGVCSSAQFSQYTYFERPLTARDASRVPPTLETDPATVEAEIAQNAKLAAERVAVEAHARAEALDGAADRQSAEFNTAWQGSWLESESPRHCRRLMDREDRALEATTSRVFAPDLAEDDVKSEAVRKRAAELLAARQHHAAAELQAKVVKSECVVSPATPTS